MPSDRPFGLYPPRANSKIEFRNFARLVFLVVIFLSCSIVVADEPVGTTNNESESKPNIIVILADDLGYADFSVEHMPRTATLFKSRGTSLHLYSHQNCAPSRAALMTGVSPVRYNQHGVFTLPINTGVPARHKLIPEYLQPAGYTTGAFGKWHLGMDVTQTPTIRGFDTFVGCRGGQIRSYGSLPGGRLYPDGTIGHAHHFRHDMAENGVSFYSPKYSTRLFRDRTIDFIESAEQPFFAYVAFNAPHSPYSAPRASFDAVKALSLIHI